MIPIRPTEAMRGFYVSMRVYTPACVNRREKNPRGLRGLYESFSCDHFVSKHERAKLINRVFGVSSITGITGRPYASWLVHKAQNTTLVSQYDLGHFFTFKNVFLA